MPRSALAVVADVEARNTSDALGSYLKAIGRHPLLTPAEEIELAQRRERGDLQARQRLVECNLRLVIPFVKMYAPATQRSDSSFAWLDLIQEGNHGLIKAAEGFDWRRGLRFSTYATPKIWGEITKALANKNRTMRISYALEYALTKILKAETSLRAEGTVPDDAAVQKRSGVTKGKLKLIREFQALQPFSYERPAGSESGTTIGELIADPRARNPELEVLSAAPRVRLEAMLQGLEDELRQILVMRIGWETAEMSVKDIGKELNLSPCQVRKRENQALQQLGDRHGDELRGLFDIKKLTNSRPLAA